MPRYRMLYRPVSSVTLPPQLSWRWAELPHDHPNLHHSQLPMSSWRYGVFETERQLSEAEREAYEIVEVA